MKFERNVGLIDATLRLAAAAAMFGLSLIYSASPVISLASAVAAVFLAATALSGRCPGYTALGISTERHDGTQRPRSG